MNGQVYVLIYHENSDSRCDADVLVFESQERAQQAMQDCYHKSLKALCHDKDIRKDDYYCWLSDDAAVIVEGIDSMNWRIEAQQIL